MVFGIFDDMCSVSEQLMEYSHLLDMADETEDPYMRMVYACKHFSSLPSCSLCVHVWLNRVTFNSIMGYICVLRFPTYVETV